MHSLDLNLSLLGKFTRFIVIGGLSAVVYFLITIAVKMGFSAEPKIASVIGYLVSIPINYAGNRYFSFRSGREINREFSRFIVVHGLNLVIVVGVMTVAVEHFHYDYLVGSLATVIVIPVVTFVFMNWWVFRPAKNSN